MRVLATIGHRLASLFPAIPRATALRAVDKPKLIWFAAALIACTPVDHTRTEANAAQHWAVYYDAKLPASTFKGYDLVVFDRRYHPDFKELQPQTKVLAYISVGEVNSDVPEKSILANGQALLDEKTSWDGQYVDISRPAWVDFVMAQAADARQRGFDGVMLDTVDSPLGRMAPQDKAWAMNREVALIEQIRAAHPTMKIMVNGGLSILPRVAPFVDYALAESMLSQTDVSTGQSHLYPPNSYQLAVSRLKEARQVAPQLKIYTLDYWNQDDVHGLQRIYATQRAQGFSPYVSTPDLRRYTPEPAGANATNEPALKERHDA